MDVTPEEILGRMRRDYPLHVKVCELEAVIARQQEEIRRLKTESAARSVGETARLTVGARTREFATGAVSVPVIRPAHQ